MAKLPLEGTRILALTVVWAGPYGGLMLADWGAEVINVESIRVFPSATRGTFARPSKEIVERAAQGSGGFPNRNPGERPFNRHASFMPLFRNKRSMTVNLNTPEGKDVFRQLVEVSDGLIENNVPGSMARLGLTYDVLSQWNPRFIMISSSGMGQTGPWKGFRGYGLHFESTFGHNSLFGYPDMGPEGSPSDVAADPAAGAAIAFAFTMALHHRNRTGKGQYIDLAQGENYLPQLGEALMDYSMNGNIRTTLGNRDPTIVQGCYPTMGDDEWITISIATDDHWQDLCDLMGKPELATDERFADSVSRYKHHDEVDEIITAWTSENDNMWLFYHLQKTKVPSGPVMHEDMAYRCPHLWERRFFLPQTQEDLGMHLYPGTVFKASKMSLSARHDPVRLGEDNDYIYKDVLKLSDEEYADLEAKGHIGTEYVPEIP